MAELTSQQNAPKRFIVFEGGEGAGKSTQASRLADALRERGEQVILSREPGGTAGAEEIRALLVTDKNIDWDPLTEALLMNAARWEHLQKIIRPALAQGQWVICDRFADSTMVYQGYGQGADKAILRELRTMVVKETEPGLTFILDLPEEIGLSRAKDRQRYENLGASFHGKLRRAFRIIAEEKDVSRCLIDAQQGVDEISRKIFAEISKRFGLSLS